MACRSACCVRAGIAVASHLLCITFVVLFVLVFCSYLYGSPPTQVPLRALSAASAFANLSAESLSDAAAFLWIQPSDVHIRERDAASTEVFREFCTAVLPRVNPAFAAPFYRLLPHTPPRTSASPCAGCWLHTNRYVIVSGDIHDGTKGGAAVQRPVCR